MTLLEGDPTSVGGYRLEGRLGAGGMGVVFLARSVSGRRLAVKVIRRELVTDEGFRTRFRREVAAARQVSGAFTAPVVDADADAEQPWLATLFVPGPSLHEYVAEHGPLPAPEVWRLAAGLVEALRDIHRVGLVHRDLKPANVLLADDGPRVIDFGIARAVTATPLTGTGAVVGTPAFMAPEQFRTGGTGPESDVFALGSVLVHAATGHAPFDGESMHGIGFRVVYEEPDLGGLPQELRPLVEACLAKEPGARPTVRDLLAVLAEPPTPAPDQPPAPQGVFGPPPAAAPPYYPPPPGPHRPSRRPRRAAVIAAATVLAVAAAVGVPLLLDHSDGGSGDGGGDAKGPGAGVTGTNSAGSTTSKAPAPAPQDADTCQSASGTLTGSGSSALGKTMTDWVSEFEQACPGVTINYSPTGAGAGLSAFLAKSTDFALTDSPLDAGSVQQSKARCSGGGQAIDLPLAATPVVLAYNLPGIDTLTLDAPTLAKIFSGRITHWNDPAIRTLNPRLSLPSLPVRAVHRGDATVLTRAFTTYLHAAAPTQWPSSAGTSWSAAGGVGANGSTGVSSLVTSTPGAVGYLPFSDATHLTTVWLATGSVYPVFVNTFAVTAALGKAKAGGSGGPLSLTLDPATRADGVYPIAVLTNAVVCSHGNDPAALPTLRAFLRYATGQLGQANAYGNGSATLGETLSADARTTVEALN
ncbi:phosphate ABC transporter substrate-binding protein PstS [Actinacidiphila bryophytorum]|uniref:phosphate ABC transporter substrate-binding protein PstS n=1 Tax=Actinacidiphila bryophytorum TaxID=1436133 RepID=UPI00217697E4|nr:phosphate ABC transporter substrate-binding protein PstS [Actinacidiphila bryophytorum]UWE07856.1 phosphate ABC transporter substrate-binding protein PstS [Actinacidiphila bryophytorum]